MSKGSITDKRVKLHASAQLLQFIYDNREHLEELPENIAKALKHAGFKLNVKVEIPNDKLTIKLPKIDTKLLNTICAQNQSADIKLPNVMSITDEEQEENTEESHAKLYLNDLIWLHYFLQRLRQQHGSKVYLYELLEKCELKLPENSILERNPELEARCERLRNKQQNIDYMNMTKNVDAALKRYPEDTIAYQLKSLNSQMIAVFQFVVSVFTGFVFGFLGIPLLIGNMDFGARIILGIFCAVIIAIAEIYFLVKKLNEYDDTYGALNKQAEATGRKSKPHVD